MDRLGDPGFLRSLRGLLEDGAYGKAVARLLSNGVHDAAEEAVRAKLESLHPKATPVDPSSLPPPQPWERDESEDGVRARLRCLREVVVAFPNGSAAGPSGLRPQHLQDVLRHDGGAASLVLTALDCFSLLCLDGKVLPAAAPFLASANLIPLRKPSPQVGTVEVRPVAVGEVLRRVVGKVALRAAPIRQAVDGLCPHQLGVGVAGACETIAQAVQSLARSFPTLGVNLLQVDLRNAFNSISRERILEEVAAQAPALLGWAQTLYGAHSHLYTQGHRLSSQQGVQQGDPLGPFLFALAWQRVVRQLPSTLGLNLWYLDDGHLVGSVEALSSALELLVTEGSRLGIDLNLAKCQMWGPAEVPEVVDEAIERLASIPRVPWQSGYGLKVLGLPVEVPGSSAFRRATLLEGVEQLRTACAVLSHLGDPQAQHLLLRYCLDGCRLMHFLRGVDCTQLADVVEQASWVLQSTLSDVLGLVVNPQDWAQASLPLRLGGLGVKDPARILPAARISGILESLMRAESLGLPPLARQTPEDLGATLLSLRSVLGGAFEPLKGWMAGSHVPFASIEPDHRRQAWWSAKVHEAHHRGLMAASTGRDACRLRLQSMRHTTAWMQSVPNHGMGTAFGGGEYRTLLRWWLGKPILQGDGGAPCPLCSTPMDVFGDHLVSCKSNDITRRHHALRCALQGVLMAAGVRTRSEVAIGGKERPCDLSLEGFDPLGPLAVDLTVVHPLALSRPREPEAVLSILAEAETQKVSKYSALCISAGWQFVPSGFHTWGGYGPLGAALWNRVVKQLVGDSQGWARAQKTMRIRQAISQALMRSIAHQLSAGGRRPPPRRSPCHLPRYRCPPQPLRRRLRRRPWVGQGPLLRPPRPPPLQPIRPHLPCQWCRGLWPSMSWRSGRRRWMRQGA